MPRNRKLQQQEWLNNQSLTESLYTHYKKWNWNNHEAGKRLLSFMVFKNIILSCYSFETKLLFNFLKLPMKSAFEHSAMHVYMCQICVNKTWLMYVCQNSGARIYKLSEGHLLDWRFQSNYCDPALSYEKGLRSEKLKT